MIIVKQCPSRHAKGLKRVPSAGTHASSYTSKNGRTKRNETEERVIERIDRRRYTYVYA